MTFETLFKSEFKFVKTYQKLQFEKFRREKVLFVNYNFQSNCVLLVENNFNWMRHTIFVCSSNLFMSISWVVAGRHPVQIMNRAYVLLFIKVNSKALTSFLPRDLCSKLSVVDANVHKHCSNLWYKFKTQSNSIWNRTHFPKSKHKLFFIHKIRMYLNILRWFTLMNLRRPVNRQPGFRTSDSQHRPERAICCLINLLETHDMSQNFHVVIQSHFEISEI